MRAIIPVCVLVMCVSVTALAQQPPRETTRQPRRIDLGFTEEDPTPAVASSKPDATPQDFSYVSLPWTGAYTPAPDALITDVRQSGLNAEALKVLDDVETPNAVRIMILDAASDQGRASKSADKLLRSWSRGGRASERLSVDRLSAERLLMIGYLAARASPDKLEALGGSSEVEKLSPMTLVMAATSRRRGDMTSRVVLGLIKAQQALNTPDDMLCAPYLCMKTAVAPFYQEWSVHPDLICAFALAGDTSGRGLDSEDPLAFCGEGRRRAEVPVFVEQARQEDRERQAATSSPGSSAGSASPQPSGTALQQELALIDVAIAQLKQEQGRMTGIERVIVAQMIVELERQRQLVATHLGGSSSSPAPASVPGADPFGIGKKITF